MTEGMCVYIHPIHLIVQQKLMKQLCGSLVTRSCPTLATQWTVACQAPLSMGFSRQESIILHLKNDILKNSKVMESRILPWACKTLENLAPLALSAACLLLSLSVPAAVPSFPFLQHTKCALAWGIHTHSSSSPEQIGTWLKYQHFQWGLLWSCC